MTARAARQSPYSHAAYSRLDRTLHQVAFAGIPAQLALADIEERLYPVPEIDIRQPVFVTSLARAGTTLLLDILSGAGGLVSHSYRHMPFLLCPLLWDRLSRPFRKGAEARERSHGDGMTIDYDSPEAFEEVLWKTFWPEHYKPDRLIAWHPAERDPEFDAFLRRHIRKILALSPHAAGQARYLSKNNANIARLPLLAAMFPDCRILLPVRDPLDHARSLLTQHRRFSEMHAQDRFSRKYMAWLGHHEFGAVLRPMDFENADGIGWMTQYGAPAPESLDFWLAYWCAAYETVLRTAGANVTIIDYDALCTDPASGLQRLSQAAGLPADTAFGPAARRLRPPTDYGTAAGFDEALADRAREIHDRLRDMARASPASQPLETCA